MLWGAFGNASSAMQAMSWDLGTIGQNIANVNTTGYKQKQTLFQTNLSEQIATPTSGNPVDNNMASGAGTSIFGVKAVDRNLINVQGAIQTTGVRTDLAINGDGFFIVAPPSGTTAPTTANLSDPNAAYYTRDGSFQQLAWQPDPQNPSDPQNALLAKSYFVNAAGDYLMGWMADPTTGTITQGGALTPVYTQPITAMPAVATTQGMVDANIPSDAPQTANPQASNIQVQDDQVPPQNQTLSLSWSRVDATTWTVTATGVTGGSLTNGGTNTYTVTTDGTGNVVSIAGGAGGPVTPPTTVPFSVTWADGGVTNQPAINLAPLAPTMTTENVSLPIYDASSSSHTLVLGFEKAGSDTWYLHFDSPEMHTSQSSTATVTDAAGASVNMGLTWSPAGGNTWTVTPNGVSGGDSASGSVTVSLTPSGTIGAVNGNPVPPATTAGTFFTVNTPGVGAVAPNIDLATVLPTFPSITSPPVQVTFDGNGQLIGPASATATVNWSNGQSTTTTIDISKLTQFSSGGSGKPLVHTTSQNGFLSGTLTSSTFNSVGQLVGTFSNGQSRTLFQVPLATFVAPNSLLPISGNMYQLTPGAGAVAVQAVDQVGLTANGVGSTRLEVASLESSNVDLQTEMTNMILAQRAYSTNAEVLKTADEMTTTARDLQT